METDQEIIKRTLPLATQWLPWSRGDVLCRLKTGSRYLIAFEGVTGVGEWTQWEIRSYSYDELVQPLIACDKKGHPVEIDA